MSTTANPLLPADARPSDGGTPARRAVVRWAWRLFRREWRQQLLILALIVVAVAATIIGAAVATNTPPPANFGFGTAQDLATFPGNDPHLASHIAALDRYGRTEVIENETVAIPGSTDSFQLRSENPSGPYSQPMLSLVSGHYPTGANQVAVTSGVATAFNLRVGDVWHQSGAARRVVGIVENPQSLLDDFALVLPGQVKSPTMVSVLFNAPGVSPNSIGSNVQTPHSASAGNALNPETISITALVLGMLLIALVAIGGFTVLAQRRLRSLGMLESLGATDRHVGLVVRANGVVVGIVGALVGFVVGLLAWLSYRPSLEQSAHHVIAMFALPWLVVVLSIVLAIVATYFAASRPARSITKIPIVAALSGRPAAPRQIHRSAIPGIIFLVISFLLLGYAGSTGGNGNAGQLELVVGIIALIPGVILLAPFCLTALARLGRRSPIAVRLALRDLARYRARSGSALSAISLGILIAIIISIASAARFGNVLDYAGPNLASNQINVYTPNGPYGSGGPGNGPGNSLTQSQLTSMGRSADAIAASLGSHEVVKLETTSATLQHAASGRQWAGPIFVATPQLLKSFGIAPSSVAPNADILTMRPGMATMTSMQLVYGNYFSLQGRGHSQNSYPCPKSSCLANPVIQEVSALPSGTSAPNTVITEHAARALGLSTSISGWLIQSPNSPTAAQITNARQIAATANLSIETRNSVPTSSEIIDWATLFGVALALGILGMSVGLIRSETASDLRILTAAGASSRTRRTLTAVTAGALGFLGAILGTVAGYVGMLGFSRSNALDGLSSLANVPVASLLIILVGMPLFAAIVGWLLAGRQPPAMMLQPME